MVQRLRANLRVTGLNRQECKLAGSSAQPLLARPEWVKTLTVSDIQPFKLQASNSPRLIAHLTRLGQMHIPIPLLLTAYPWFPLSFTTSIVADPMGTSRDGLVSNFLGLPRCRYALLSPPATLSCGLQLVPVEGGVLVAIVVRYSSVITVFERSMRNTATRAKWIGTAATNAFTSF